MRTEALFPTPAFAADADDEDRPRRLFDVMFATDSATAGHHQLLEF